MKKLLFILPFALFAGVCKAQAPAAIDGAKILESQKGGKKTVQVVETGTAQPMNATDLLNSQRGGVKTYVEKPGNTDIPKAVSSAIDAPAGTKKSTPKD